MKIINKINDELIDIREYAKPNVCFQTNEYPDNYNFCIFHEQFNPFDLFNDNKEKDKEIERLNNIINELEEELEREIKFGKTISKEADNYNSSLDIRHTLEKVFERLKELKGSDKE